MSVAVKALESTRAALDAIVARAEARYDAQRTQVFRDTDRMFARLMIAQWVFAVVLALVISPYAWQGKDKTIHLHVWVAVFLGGAIISLPVFLARARPARCSRATWSPSRRCSGRRCSST